jgi:hypothetical protein
MNVAYRFTDVLSGYFEFPTDNARRLLPGHLEPIEVHHGASVFSLSVLDIVESPVGPYRAVAASVLVVPIIKGGGDEVVPTSAFYPFLFGTTTAAAREAGIGFLHLPHWMEDVTIEIVKAGKTAAAHVSAQGEKVADLTIAEYSWDPVSQLYQCFMKDGSGAYMTKVHATGTLSDHQEETGSLTLHDHPFNTGLAIADVYDVPMRETWLKDGVQSFEPLVQLQPV